MKTKPTIEDMHNSLSELDKVILKLGKSITDLKCCGNCKESDECPYVDTNNPHRVCIKNWQWDGLKEEDRKW